MCEGVWVHCICALMQCCGMLWHGRPRLGISRACSECAAAVQCPSSCRCNGTFITGCFPSVGPKRGSAGDVTVSVNVLECPRPSQRHPSACNPQQLSEFACSDGVVSSAFMCAVCSHGWFHDGLACKRCTVWNQALLPVFFIVGLGGMVGWLWWQSGKAIATERRDDKPGATASIAMNYVQLVGVFVSSGHWISFWSSAANDGVASTTHVLSFSLSAFQCLDEAFTWRAVVTVTLCGPFIFISMVGVSYAVSLLHQCGVRARVGAERRDGGELSIRRRRCVSDGCSGMPRTLCCGCKTRSWLCSRRRPHDGRRRVDDDGADLQSFRNAGVGLVPLLVRGGSVEDDEHWDDEHWAPASTISIGGSSAPLLVSMDHRAPTAVDLNGENASSVRRALSPAAEEPLLDGDAVERGSVAISEHVTYGSVAGSADAAASVQPTVTSKTPPVMDRMISTLIGLVDFWYLRCAVTILELWTCTVHDHVSGVSVLHSKPWVQCESVRPLLPVLVVAFVGYIVCFPAFALLTLRRNRSHHDGEAVARLSDATVVRRYGIWLRYSREPVYWWTVAQYPQRVIVAVVSTVLPPAQAVYYFIIMVFILQVQLLLATHVKPYHHADDNVLHIVSLYGLLSASATGLFHASLGQGDHKTTAVLAVEFCSILANAVVLVFILTQVVMCCDTSVLDGAPSPLPVIANWCCTWQIARKVVMPGLRTLTAMRRRADPAD